MAAFESLALGVLGSVIGGVILLGVASVASRRARWLVVAVLGHLAGVEVEDAFTSSVAAAADLRRSLARASDVRVLTGRGQELQLDPWDTLFSRATAGHAHVRILLPITRVPADTFNFTEQRDRELGLIDASFGRGLLETQIETVAAYLSGRAGPNIQLRRRNGPQFGRVVLTDRYAYVTMYPAAGHGRDATVVKFRHGDTFEGYSRLFNLEWEAAGARDAGVAAATGAES